jgi:tight adherence protein C
MWSETLILSISVFCLTMASAVSIYLATGAGSWRPKRQLNRALLLDLPDVLARDPTVVEFLATGFLSRWLESSFKTLLEQPRVRKLRKLLGADMDHADEQAISKSIQIVMSIAGLLIAVVLALAFDFSVLISGICGVAIGYVVPDYLVQRSKRQKRIKLTRELPAILDLLVVTLEAGLGLGDAIRMVGRQTERQGSALGKELSTVAAELGAGVSLTEAMRSLADRTGVGEIKSLAAVLIQSEQIGARLGPALRSTAELMTNKRRLRAEEIAQKSTIKMLIPLVFLILPAMMIVILGPALIQVFDTITKN